MVRKHADLLDLNGLPLPPPLSKIPTARLRELIESWLRGGDGTRTLRELERACGVGERVLGAIMRGERESVTFGVADRVIILGFGDPLLWILPPPDGLRDLYLDWLDDHLDGSKNSLEEAA